MLFFRTHNITLISAFPPDFHIEGLEEIAPEGVVSYVRNYMTWDLVGARMKGEDPLPKKDIFRYGYEVEGCGIMATDYLFRFLDPFKLLVLSKNTLR